jgi:glycosyltransferase involved in cell wall biosynthesis
MRIAAITNSRIPSLTANSIQAMKVCQALTQLGHDVRIFAPLETDVVSPEVLRKHYGLSIAPDLELFPSIRRLKRFDFILHAQSAARKFKADLIYTWLPQSAVIGLWHGYPVILEMHADVTGHLGAWWIRRFWKAGGRKRMTVTTQALRNALERSTGFIIPERGGFANEAVIVAPNGVDLETYENLPAASKARRQLNLEDGLTVGFTGHIYPGRGADLLFELAQRMPQVNFLWVGGTPELVSYWQAQLSDSQLKNVTMTGFIEHGRVPLYQAASDILLMPYGRSISASSGQDIAEVINPMKMFEYMASGRAIASADLPVIREVLNEKNAVFCEPGNANQWKSAIESLAADEKRRTALGAQARKDVESYTWTERAHRILDGFA